MNKLAITILGKTFLVFAPAAFLLVVLLVWVRNFIQQQYGFIPSKWILMVIFAASCWLLVKWLLLEDLKKAEAQHKAKMPNQQR